MDYEEEYRLPDAQTGEEQAKVKNVVDGHETGLCQGVLCFFLEQEANAKDQERDPSQQLQWEEQVCLVFHHKAKKSLLALCLFLGKGEHRDSDVGIKFGFIGMAMMPVVLIEPPTPTPTEQEIRHDKATGLEQPVCAENLPMPQIMTDEANLSKDKGQKDRIEELERGMLCNEQEGKAESQ